MRHGYPRKRARATSSHTQCRGAQSLTHRSLRLIGCDTERFLSLTALPESRLDGPLPRRSASSSLPASGAGALVEVPKETPLPRGLDDEGFAVDVDGARADAVGWAELGGGDDLRTPAVA